MHVKGLTIETDGHDASVSTVLALVISTGSNKVPERSEPTPLKLYVPSMS